MWYFIQVEKPEDIGIYELIRYKAKWDSCETISKAGEYPKKMKFDIVCDPVCPANKRKEETDSAPTGKSLEERVKSLENAVLDNLHDAVQTDINTRLIDVMYETQPKANKWFQDEIAKVKQEMESRTEQLSDEHNELKNAFEAECDKYDAEFENLFTSTGQWTTIGQGILDKNKREIKNIQQQLSELQQAFIKYAICKKTESPEGGKSFTTAVETEPGEFVFNSSGQPIGFIDRKTTPSGITVPPDEPDLVEQIKAGENRLWELRKSVDCVAAIANSASETVSLKEHLIKLMSIHTGLNITGIRMCNRTYKIHYNCKEKGIYVELD